MENFIYFIVAWAVMFGSYCLFDLILHKVVNWSNGLVVSTAVSITLLVLKLIGNSL